MAMRGLLFLVWMWASEKRFRRHARRRDALRARAERCGARMAAEVDYREALCRRHQVRGYASRTASGVPAVSSLDGLTMPAGAARPPAPGPAAPG